MLVRLSRCHLSRRVPADSVHSARPGTSMRIKLSKHVAYCNCSICLFYVHLQLPKADHVVAQILCPCNLVSTVCGWQDPVSVKMSDVSI